MQIHPPCQRAGITKNPGVFRKTSRPMEYETMDVGANGCVFGFFDFEFPRSWADYY
jgi:hypothetical protein